MSAGRTNASAEQGPAGRGHPRFSHTPRVRGWSPLAHPESGAGLSHTPCAGLVFPLSCEGRSLTPLSQASGAHGLTGREGRQGIPRPLVSDSGPESQHVVLSFWRGPRATVWVSEVQADTQGPAQEASPGRHVAALEG